jgi:hypothetical protein
MRPLISKDCIHILKHGEEKTMKLKWRFQFGISLLVALVLILTPLALASDVGVSVVDVTAPTGSVTLAPGGSGAITINMTVNGKQDGTATFDVYRDWTLSGGLFAGSNPETFTVPPRAAQDDPTTFSTTGTVTVAAGQIAGTFTLAVSAFDITNSNATGAKLADGADSNYEVIVSAPSDTTPPVITPNVSGTLGSNGWYVSDVIVSWTVSDPESGIASSSGCGSTTISSDTSGTTFTCSATNGVGLSNSASVTIKRDVTPPNISASLDRAPASTGWYNASTGAPIVSFTCYDATSGLAGPCPSAYTFGEGENQAYSETIYDNAGNSASAGVSDIDVDLTAPSISASVSPAAAPTGWWNIDTGAPTVSFTCSDDTSGLAGACPAAYIFGEGENQSYSGTIHDNAGNSASAGVSDIDVDLTAPTISGSAEPAPNANGWNNTDVTVTFTCGDSLSDIAYCSPSQTLSSEGADQSATGTAVDNAGNSATATVSGINIDLTAPTLTIVVPEPYDVRPLGTALNFWATDGLSGLDGTAMAKLNGGTPQKSGYPPPVGVYTVEIYATDNAGNKTSETRTLVIYDPSAGFVTGGGWIMSPARAYAPDPTLTGKATFGFVSKYLKNATVPTGETQFQFHAGSLNFHSVSYEWLVVTGTTTTGSNYARYKGSGTVNGVGGYKFMLWAGDGTGPAGADTFRIKIWQEDDAGTETVLYDNGTDQAIGSGSIVVHTGKK